MLAPLLLSLICLVLLGLSIHLFFRGVRQTGIERVMDRLAQGQPQLELQKTRWSGLDRAFLRAGMGRPTERMGLWLLLWIERVPLVRVGAFPQPAVVAAAAIPPPVPVSAAPAGVAPTAVNAGE